MTMILACAVLGSACSDDGPAGDATGSSTGAGTTAAETDAPGTTAMTTEPGSSSGPTPGTTSGSSDTGVVDSTSASTGVETETDTAGVDCDAIAPGPLAVEVVFEPEAVFDGTEDIAFDGQGNVAGKNGNEVLLVAADGSLVDSWPDAGPGYGLRFRGNGDLLAAKFSLSEIRIVNGDGPLLTMAGGVNGLWPDFDDNVWFTNGNSVRRFNADGTVDPIVTGGDAASSNGVVLDTTRGLLFFSNYGLGLIRSVEIMGDGSPGAISMVTGIPGAALDGLNMDACGNLYAMDQGNAALYRIYLDDAGAAIGDPEPLVAQFPENVANAVWGSGPGWDPLSLYAAGFPGGIYRVEIGVPGTPYPTP
jgi:hypothetical protein